MGIKKIGLGGGGGGGGGASWGSITGVLASQTDLITALNNKANATDLPLTKNTPTTSQVILSGYSSIVSNIYEIANTLTLEIENTAIFEIS
jgi:hypothetical protein